MIADLGLFAARLVSSHRVKERLIRHGLGGQAVSRIAEHVEWFCRAWLPSSIHPIGESALRRHQQQGHRIVLVSASPDLYVPRIAESFGIRETVCTRIVVEADRVVGDIAGANCKGTAKVAMLTSYQKLDSAPQES